MSADCNALDELFEIDRYLARNIRHRLAFREFGTCMGIGCYTDKDMDNKRVVNLKSYADAILESWEPYMEISLSKDEKQLDVNDLRPITRVMYASALIPGGKVFNPGSQHSVN